MKILVVSLAYHPFIGGAEVAIAEITKRLPEHQWRLLTVNLDGRQPARERIGNVDVERIGRGRLGKTLFPLTAAWRGWQILRQERTDLVWAMMANQAGLAAMFLSYLRPRVPYLLTLQEGDSEQTISRKTRLIKPLYRRIYLRARQIQAISNYLAVRARQYRYRGEINIVPNGVDLLSEPGSDLPHRLGQRRLITVSRLVEKNGVADLIAALPQIEGTLDIIGDGPLRGALERQARELGVAERVHFAGALPYTEVFTQLRRASVFIRSSYSEGLGNAFLEAMAMKVPVVGTPVGGIVDFLTDRETGWYCQVGTPATIADAVNHILNPDHQSEVMRVVDTAYDLVVSRYGWDIIARDIRDIITHCAH